MKNVKLSVLVLVIVTIAVSGCRTMYQLELANPNEPNRSVGTQFPNYVNMLVRVTDKRVTTTDSDGNTVPDFSNPDYYVVGLEPTEEGRPKGTFSVFENDVEIQVEAGLRVVPLEELELHLHLLLDVSGSVGEVGLVQAKNAAKRLVARPLNDDESAASVPESFRYRYTDWDEETEAFVERDELWVSTLKDNQIVSIYTFANNVRRLTLRESDGRGARYQNKARQVLETIDRDVQLGVDSTNLYGAMLAGLEDLAAIRTLSDPNQGFVDGIVVVFTDGSHTAGNIQHRGTSYTPQQAIQRIQTLRGSRTDLESLRVITIAVDTPELAEEIETGNLTGGGLRQLQNAGYLKVDNYSRLERRFVEAFELIDRYTRSLYWIYYRSPKSGVQNVDISLRVTCRWCEKGPNGTAPEYATIQESIRTNGFYQVLPGVYINDPILDENGNVAEILDADGENQAYMGPESIVIRTERDSEVPESNLYTLILANNPEATVREPANTHLLRIHTYVRANDNRFRPRYTVTSSDPSTISVIGYTGVTPIESVALIEALRPGSATIDVVDVANGNLRRSIVVRSEIQ